MLHNRTLAGKLKRMSEQLPGGVPTPWFETKAAYAAATAYTYPGATPVLTTLARCFVHVDSAERRGLGAAVASLRALDEILDANKPPKPGLANPPPAAERLRTYRMFEASLTNPGATPDPRTIPWVRSSTLNSVRFWGEALRSRSETNRSRTLAAVRAIGDISVQKARTTDITEYRNLLVQEGRWLSPWVFGSLNCGDSPAHKELLEWGAHLGAAGVLFFAALDLKEDYDEGRVRIPASLGGRFRLAAGIRHHLGPLAIGLIRGMASRLSLRH